MKKLFIISAIASIFAACNNTPAVSESATKIAGLTTWVDSIKNVISSTTEFDSATWAGYSESFNTAIAGINEAELDETSKATFEGIKTTWGEVGTSYTQGMEAAKAKAMEVMNADSTMTNAAEVQADGKNIIEKAKEVVKDGKDLMKK